MTGTAADPAAVAGSRVLGPVKRRVALSDFWDTRRVAWMIAQRDMRAKYKQAALGPLWLILAPLGMLAAVTIAFSGVTDVHTSGIAYVPFALCALCVWTYIQLSLLVGAQAIVANSQLVRRSSLPRLALMTGTLLGNVPPLAVMTVAALATAGIDGLLPIQALLLPVLLVWLFVFTLAVTLLISALAARFRDVIAILPMVIQAGIFVTPVGYGLSGVPSHIKTLLILNPATGIIETWRWAFVALPNPNVVAIVVAGVWTVVLAIGGWYVFGRMEVDFADYV